MKIKTEILKEMVSKAIKGAGNNRLLPITNYIGIELKDNILTLITTDGNNQLKIKQNLEKEIADVCQQFYTIVNADTFSKLVSKTTSEFIELENKENYLEVKANKGTYKLEIPINEEGKMVEFPEQERFLKENIPNIVKINSLKELLSNMKVALAKTLETPCLTGYYLGNSNVSTDRQTMTYTNNIIFENPMLISSEMGELLQLLEGENVNVFRNGNKLLFETNNISIYGPELEGKDIYPVQQIQDVINLSYLNIAKVNKNELSNILDRMEIFITPYEKNGIYLNFKGNKLSITSQASTATEEIEIKENEADFTCLVDVVMLQDILKNIVGEEVEIHFGQKSSILIKEGNVSYVLSLLAKAN